MRVRRLSLASPGPAPGPGEAVTLDLRESRHGALVLRLKEGDEVELVARQGIAKAVVTASAKKPVPSLTLTIITPFEKERVPGGPTLLLPLIRPARFEWALEKCVELGAARLIPYSSSRTRSSGAAPDRAARWERIAAEARKQSGAAYPLEILPPEELPRLLERIKDCGQGQYLCLLDREGPPLALSLGPGAPVTLLVGPEGGLSAEERDAALKASFRPFSLGPGRLRTETAAVAALAIIAVSQKP
ncbi:MAG: 16S rRNA (uracil(1498)-N(3))-methyltransferase [Deltaproteobacteria bacterium]|jgi:16S rRNA (uracil1498-N3)-methyltransferase|nr:16S rRNA (uracil(1498)-N(3))-methyltransferase [Deltaproteobacteria bacterium]